MIMEKLLEKIEALGNARDYKGQAAVFLDATGAKIEARYLRTGPYFEGESIKDSRDIYEFRITRGSRVYQAEFGESITGTEKRILLLAPPAAKGLESRVRMGEDVSGVAYGMQYMYPRRLREWTAAHKEWMDVRDKNAGQRPSAYSILSAMTTCEPPQNVDDFADEYGFTKPSEALRVFAAVQKEWQGMRELFTDDEIAALSRIA